MILFDTETTGLPKPSAANLELQPKIIEFAAVKVDSKFNIVDELEFMCNPGHPLEPIITKITGIKDSDLADKESFSYHLDSVASFFKGAKQITAHNHEFDRRLMYFELLRRGWTDGFPGCYAECICTVEATFHLKNRRLKMTELYEIATGKPLAQKHRAMDDVLALLECVKWCVAEGIPL